MSRYRTADYKRLHSHVGLDRSNLDQEVSQLPSLILEATDIANEVATNLEESSLKVSIVKAEVYDRLRVDMLNREKPRSEAQIGTEYLLEDDMQFALRDVETLKSELAKWRALVDALRSKKSAIETTCQMIMAGYFVADSVYEKNKQELDNARSKRRAGGGV